MVNQKKDPGHLPYGPLKFKTIDDYHTSHQGRVREQLDEIRRIIRSTIPDASETISYNMPTFRKFRNLVYYAAHKNHIGLYPGSAPIQIFEDDLKAFKTSKGAIQLPLDQDIPAELIKRILRYAVSQDDLKAAAKKKS